MNEIIFNNESEVVEDYLKEYDKVKKEEIETSYHNHDKKKIFCVRIKGTKGMDSFKTYTVTRAGKYKLY